MHTPNKKEGDEIKVHSTCIHSDKYDYCCGECHRKTLALSRQEGREEERERIKSLIMEHSREEYGKIYGADGHLVVSTDKLMLVLSLEE